MSIGTNAANGINPIIKVNGTAVGSSFPVPSKFEWQRQDISQSDAGRDTTGYMHKERVAYAVSVNLEWSYLTSAQAAAVISKFNDEYFTMTYIDPSVGGQKTYQFYRGDITAEMYSTAYPWNEQSTGSKTHLWTKISFNLISRGTSV